MSVTYPNIAVLGKAGAGKDTVAELLAERFDLGYTRFALADPLKRIALTLFGEGADKDREILQDLGIAVRGVRRDAWVDLLFRRIAEIEAVVGRRRVVVTDCRFANELHRFEQAGYVTVRVHAHKHLRIDRLRANGKLQDETALDHVSETELDGVDTDYRVENNGTTDELAEQLARILNREVR